MWHKSLLCIFLLSLSISNCFAKKISVGFGAYSLNAKVGDSETSLANLGSYRIQYHSQIQENFELLIAYNIVIEKTIRGDKSFGPFVGFSYYPFGSKTNTQSSISNISISTIKNLNPYVYTGFNQRQYQSVKATYSGFSLGAGVEAGWSKDITFFSDFQYAVLDGPNTGEATEFIALGGLMFTY